MGIGFGWLALLPPQFLNSPCGSHSSVAGSHFSLIFFVTLYSAKFDKFSQFFYKETTTRSYPVVEIILKEQKML